MLTKSHIKNLLINNSADLISLHDIEGLYLFASSYCETLLGYEPHELVGCNSYEFFHPEDLERVSKSHDLIINGGSPFSVEYRYKHKNGSYVWVETVSKTIVSEEDGQTYILANTRGIEDRKDLEKKLFENERYLKEAQEIAKLGHYVLDIESGIWDSSDALDNIFGIGQSYNRDIEGWLNLVHPDYRESMKQYFTNEILGKQVLFDKVYPIINQADHTVRWVHGYGKLKKDQTGRLDEMFGVIQDITHQYNNEKEQRLLKNKLNALWKIAQLIDADIKKVCDCILSEIIDLTESHYGFYGFLDGNEKNLTIYSWSELAMNDCSIHDKPLEFPIEQSGVWGNAVRNKSPFILNDYQSECANKKGIPEGHVSLKRVLSIPIIINGKIVALAAVANKKTDYQEDDVNQLLGFLKNAQILVDRNRLQSELSDREGYYRLLFEEAVHGAAIADLETGQILSCNNKLAALVGRSKDEIIGQHQSFLHFPFCSHEKVSQSYSHHMTDSEGDVLEDQLFHKDGYYVDVEIMANRLNVSGKEVLHGVFYDISENKKLMSEQARTAQLSALGTVAAGVAHEINNPIQGIINYSELLEMRSESDNQTKDIAKRITEESERIAKLTQSLLDYAKDNRKEIVPSDIKKLVETTTNLIATKIRHGGVNLDIDIADNLPMIKLQPQSFQQVIINLIENAYDAIRYKEYSSEQGLIELHADICEENGNRSLFIKVKDNGVGMSSEVIEKARTAFFTTKPTSEGTGLGLSIVADIINKHRGSMEIESVEGQGSVFKVYFPL